MGHMGKSSETLNILASNLIRLRREKGWNQLRLAEESGVNVGVIKSAETRVSMPRVHNLDAMAGALGISTQDLLGATKPAPSMSIQELARTITEQAAEIEFLKSGFKGLTIEESDLLRFFRQIGTVERNEVIALAKRFLAIDNAKTTPTRKRG